MVSKPLDYMCLGTRFGSGPSIAASSSYRVFWLSGGQAGQPNLQSGTFCAGNEVRPVGFFNLGGEDTYVMCIAILLLCFMCISED